MTHTIEVPHDEITRVAVGCEVPSTGVVIRGFTVYEDGRALGALRQMVLGLGANAATTIEYDPQVA